MGQYIELIKNVGVPVAVAMLVAGWLAWFIYRTLWPFLTKQIEATQGVLKEQLHNAHLARTEALKEFLVALDRRDALLKEIMDDHDRIREALDRLTDEIRNQQRDRGR